MKKYLNRALLIITVLSLSLSLPGQQNKTSASDTSTSAKSRHSLYSMAGTGYNMVYMGTSLSQDKPYYSASLVYGFNSELFLSVSGFHLAAYDPFFSFSTYSLSYSHAFSSWFDISAGISGYQVNKILSDTLFTNFVYGDISLGFDWKILYTKISAGELFSGSNGTYFQLRNSRYFMTSELGRKKAWFSFDPYVNMLFGTLTETKDGSLVVSPPFGKGGSGGGSSSETTSRFSLMELDFGLPVSFNIGKFTLDAEPGYVFPLYSDPSGPDISGFVFTLGLIFRIF
ncbi:MAG: hypothetical protein MUE74_06515 [Bacteroidales bacterium]|jgi:hypothetical protein|nr:hypothetical protein [Bacteroidales bacterium]